MISPPNATADAVRRALAPASTDDARREVLVGLAADDLLGPAGGLTERLFDLPGSTANAPRNRYLVGVLRARREGDGEDEGRPGGTAAGPDDPGDGGDIPEVEELAIGGADNPQDGPTDLSVPADRFLWPSSMGLSFCVEPGVDELKVIARWGQYTREVTEPDEDPEGGEKARKFWQRHPRGGEVRVRLNEGPLLPVTVDSECPDVVIRGRVRHVEPDGEPGHTSVTLFLCNDQVEPDRLRDQTWLFQPELVAEAPDGAAVFGRRRKGAESGRWSELDARERLERDTLSMLYRKDVEFAVGHGVATETKVHPDDPTRAVRIGTAIVPRQIVPQVTPADDRRRRPEPGVR